MGNKVCFLDICGTIVKENTTFSFLEFIFPCSKLWKIRRLFIIKALNRGVLALTKFDLVKYLALRKLNGYDKKKLEMLSKEFIELLSYNNDVLLTVKDLEKEGYSIVIVSATLDIIAKAFCEKFYFQAYISSRLSYSNNICLGVLERDILLNKHDYIIDSLKEVNESCFVTDNKTDVSACLMCNIFIPIVYNKKDKLFWSKFNPEKVIEID